MTTFIISYDLRKPNYTEADYEDLYNELDYIGAKRIQESVWGVKSTDEAKTLHDQLWQHMHRKDRLLVFGGDAGGYRSTNGINKISTL